MDYREPLKPLIAQFNPQELTRFFRTAAGSFRPQTESLQSYRRDDQFLDKIERLGLIPFDDTEEFLLVAIHTTRELTTRTGKKQQYDLAKRILKGEGTDGGIFVFYDDRGHFRFSLVTAHYYGTRRQFSNYRRYTFFVSPDLPNKTFLNQIGRADFSSIDAIRQAFSIEAVSDEFYKEFKPKFDEIARNVTGAPTDQSLREDFALLFVIRIIFLGFVQKKGWLGDNKNFLPDFWREYQSANAGKNLFYADWLTPLFFEALNNPPGRKISYGRAPFAPETQEALQMSPYLNGELFKRKRGIDDRGLTIPDAQIAAFFEFLFQYNFTVEENELYDEELELNPEFLGIIFERLTNKDQGAVYTPRVEVDLMCRLALEKWLEENTAAEQKDLYHLLFREAGTDEEYDEYQKQGDFSPAEIRELVNLLEKVTVCDPAAGSGAFEVGMLQALENVLENLYSRNNAPADLKANAPTPFERKKAIIANSLYGVEVKHWAVWINHLRLWLSLFVDMPDNFRNSFKPLLPNLTFKVRAGDSLVQELGGKTFPIRGHANLSPAIKGKITKLKKKKRNFFYNQSDDYRPIEREELNIFREILDAEIASRQNELKTLNAAQLGFLDAADTAAASKKSKRDRLTAEIADLQSQKRTLKDDRPFIWSIEFAEIFFDRGGFDIIIGNPPYVRQEDIADPQNNAPPKAYKAKLLEMTQRDFPAYFGAGKNFKKNRKPSGRSDLYTYFYIRSLRLLNPKGIHVFICSNSWLDVGYGAWLQEFLLRNTPVHFIIDNHARRSFASADVNTIISMLGAPRNQGLNDHLLKFVAFKQPFENVILSNNLREIEKTRQSARNNRFRVYPIAAKDLLAEGSDPNGKYVGDKWGGKYLRAPDIFFTILEKGKGKLVKLGDIADVRRGFTTGANDFFYLEPLGRGSRRGLMRVRNGAGWEGEIEEEFLKPVIKSPRESRTIVIDPAQLRYRLFMCHKNKRELQGTQALEYILWGEDFEIEIKSGKRKGEKIIGYHNLPTLKSRKMWWNLGSRRSPKFIVTKGPWTRHFVMVNNDGILCDQQLYEIYANNQYLYHFINATMTYLFFELEGRRNFGEGILWLAAYEISNIRIYKDTNTQGIKLGIEKRDVQDIFTECGIDPKSNIPIAEQEPNPLPDRKALDDIVFDALNLTPEERKEVYRAVCQLVWNRISKAKSV